MLPRGDDGAQLAAAENGVALRSESNGCAGNAVSAFANCGLAFASVRNSIQALCQGILETSAKVYTPAGHP